MWKRKRTGVEEEKTGVEEKKKTGVEEEKTGVEKTPEQVWKRKNTE